MDKKDLMDKQDDLSDSETSASDDESDHDHTVSNDDQDDGEVCFDFKTYLINPE